MKTKPEIRTLSNDQPHECYGGWRGFLDTCEERDTVGETIFYGSSNCNYILLPNNVVLENFGYHGRNLMNRIREEGWETVFNEWETVFNEIQELLAS